MGLPDVWGATAEECARHYPADDLIGQPRRVLTRAIPVDAPAALTWLWLGQVAVAPYSYDLIDNLGRRSPDQLTGGIDKVTPGGRAMIYRVVDVVPGEQWTGIMLPGPARLFGASSITYVAVPVDADHSRILCRLVTSSASLVRRLGAPALAWGDLVMMRKQLRTLARYAGRDARAAAGRGTVAGPSPA